MPFQVRHESWSPSRVRRESLGKQGLTSVLALFLFFHKSLRLETAEMLIFCIYEIVHN